MEVGWPETHDDSLRVLITLSIRSILGTAGDLIASGIVKSSDDPGSTVLD